MTEKRPSFQFYPGDWRRDAALQSCSVPARGLWTEMLCIMHDGKPYGHLRVGRKNITPDVLANMVGAEITEVEEWLAELDEADVFSRTETGTIYCRRMVKDEDIRQKRASAGQKGGNKTSKHFAKAKRQAKLKQTVADADEDVVQKDGKADKADFIDVVKEVRARYPRRSGGQRWRDAEPRIEDATKKYGTDTVLAAVDRYRRWCDATGKTGGETVKMAATFFGRNVAEHIEDDWRPPPPGTNGNGRHPPDAEAARVRSEYPGAGRGGVSDLERVVAAKEQKADRARDEAVDKWLRKNPDRAESWLADKAAELGDGIGTRVAVRAMLRSWVARECLKLEEPP